MYLLRKDGFGRVLPRHQAYRFIFGYRSRIIDRDKLAIAQNCDAVAEMDHLVPAMGDEQHNRVGASQPSGERGEPFHLAPPKRGRRLVQQQNPWATLDRPDDLEHLLLAE